MPEPSFHRIYVDIPMDIWEDLKKILPYRGMVSQVTRSLLITYVDYYHSEKHNALEKGASFTVKRCKICGCLV